MLPHPGLINYQKTKVQVTKVRSNIEREPGSPKHIGSMRLGRKIPISQYARISTHHGKKRVSVAVAHSFLIAKYHVLKNKTGY